MNFHGKFGLVLGILSTKNAHLEFQIMQISFTLLGISGKFLELDRNFGQ